MVELFEKLSIIIYVTLDHKTSHKGTFFLIETYTASESWINKPPIDVYWNYTLYLAKILFKILKYLTI